MTELHILTGPLAGRVLTLEGDVISIGRAPGNTVEIHDPSVSRKHARLLKEGERFFIEDLNSRNGIVIEGRPLRPGKRTALAPGIPVVLGNVVFSIGAPVSEEGMVTRHAPDAEDPLSGKGHGVLSDTLITDRKDLELIHGVSSALMTSLDVNVICEKVMEALFSRFRLIDHASVILIDPNTGEPEEIMARSAEMGKGGKDHFSRSVVDRVLSEARSVILSKPGGGEGEDVSPDMETEKIHAVMCVPLISRSRTRGVVYLHSLGPRGDFRKEDLAWLTSLSGPLAVAIENATLYEKTKKAEESLRAAYEKLELRVDERTADLRDAKERLEGEIREHKRAEEAARQSEERYRDLFENANDLIQSIAPDGRFIYVNRAWRETLGYGEHEVALLSLFDVIHPDSREHCMDLFPRILAGETVERMEVAFQTKDGGKVILEGSANCRIEEGKPVSTRAIFRDITERRLAEEALRISEERFRRMAVSAHDAIVSVDNDGLIYYWNKAAERIFGYLEGEVIGKNLHRLLASEKYAPEYQKAFERWKNTGRGPAIGTTRELTARRKDGTEFPIELSLSSVMVKGKWNAVGMVRDITQRKHAEEALAQARERELQIGARIQQTLLLGSPPQDIPGMRLAALTVPSLGIDGDFYDFFRHSDHCVDIIVGDVMGKGVPAALLGAGLKSSFFRALSDLMPFRRDFPQPREILQKVQQRMAKELIALETFATLCYTRIDLNRRCVDLIDCGHTRTIHFHGASGRCTTLEGLNMPLGFIEKETFQPTTFSLEPGDVLFFYSDGVTEARDGEGRFFGEDRLLEQVQSHVHMDPEDLIREVHEAVKAFTQAESFADDLTCVAVKIHKTGDVEPLLNREMETAADMAQLGKIREFVEQFGREHLRGGLDDQDIWNLNLAVHETAANIIEHAYRGRSGQKIRIRASGYAGRVVIQLIHWGDPFDPPQDIRLPPLDGTRENGFGLFITHNLVDGITYAREGDGSNAIRLLKIKKPH